MPWHGRRPAGTRSPSVLPALFAALALLLGLPLAGAANAAETTRHVGAVAVAGTSADRADKLSRHSAPILKLGRAESLRSGPMDRLDHGFADLAGPSPAARLALLDVVPVLSADPSLAPTRSQLRSRAPPMPHAVLASGIPLLRR